MTLDPHYSHPRLARLYDHDCGWGPDRAFYLSLAGPLPLCVLDLGCGTGILSHAYARLGHHVTAVDPAASMLAVARQKPNSSRIHWVNSTAQDFRGTPRFDLVVMTGHAFQVLISDTEIAATFSVIRDHLAPTSRVAFETRNPEVDWVQRWHGSARVIEADGQQVHQSYHVTSAAAELITFDTHYLFSDARMSSTSTLRFASQDRIATLLSAGGLRVQSVFGGWNSEPFDCSVSDEMIFIAGH